MADLKRVYHPETYEPFDVPVARASELVLNQGWLQTRPDPTAEPAVKTVAPESGTDTVIILDDDWRDSAEVEVVDLRAPRRRQGKK